MPEAPPIVQDFSADGRRVAFSYMIAVGKWVFKVYDFLSEKVILEHNTTAQWLGQVQFSLDGSNLFVYEITKRWTGKPNLIHVLDLETGTERIAIPDPLP